MVVGSRCVAYFQQYAKFKRKQWAIERPCTLYSIDFCAFDSGKHKQMWMCKWDPDAVARFNLTTNSCVLLDALCSELCSLSCVLCALFSYSLSTVLVAHMVVYRLQRLCTCFHFGSIHNLYNIHTSLFDYMCWTLALPTHIVKYILAWTTSVHYLYKRSQRIVVYTLQFQCFGLSVLP